MTATPDPGTPPRPVLLDISTKDTLYTSLAALDADTRRAITDTIAAVNHDLWHQCIVDQVRTTLDRSQLNTLAVGVMFRAEFTRGNWRLPPHGMVLYTDDTTPTGFNAVAVAFTDGLAEAMNGRNVVDHRTRLVLDLRTDTIIVDHNAHFTLYETFAP